MVFKGRFFSSKKSDTSSPDGSSNNSPRSLGSNSPSRSEKKKVKSTAKEAQISSTSSSAVGGSSGRELGVAAVRRQLQVKDGIKKDANDKESQTRGESRLTAMRPSSGAELGSSSESKSKRATAVDGKESSSSSVSPILASSLGLNRIKMRSGPLPQESSLGLEMIRGPLLVQVTFLDLVVMGAQGQQVKERRSW